MLHPGVVPRLAVWEDNEVVTAAEEMRLRRWVASMSRRELRRSLALVNRACPDPGEHAQEAWLTLRGLVHAEVLEREMNGVEVL